MILYRPISMVSLLKAMMELSTGTTLKFSLILLITQKSKEIANFTELPYIQGYPRILMAEIWQSGLCPCPRCEILLSDVHNFGTPADKESRINLAWVSNSQYQNLIRLARKAIFEQKQSVSSAHVEQLLKPKSLMAISVGSRAFSHY